MLCSGRGGAGCFLPNARIPSVSGLLLKGRRLLFKDPYARTRRAISPSGFQICLLFYFEVDLQRGDSVLLLVAEGALSVNRAVLIRCSKFEVTRP